MRKIIMILFLLLSSLQMASAQEITGTWRGVLDTGTDKLRLVLHISGEEGDYSTTMDSPDQRLSGLPTTSTVFTDGIVTVVARDLNMTYKAELNGDRLSGNFRQFGLSVNLEMMRDKPVMPVPGEEITGTWNGMLKVGKGSMPIVFRIVADENGINAVMDSPYQGVKGIEATTASFNEGILRITEASSAVIYEAVFDGNMFRGTFTQAGNSLPLDLERGDFVLNRPQTPMKPFPYNSEYVTFENREAGITLAGTFTYPREGSAFPAVVLITGSGAQNRDEEIMGHKPFLVIADYLTRNGIAVLRYDDRGTAQSGGIYSEATIYDFVSDAEAAVSYLKTRKEVHPKKVGLLGHSEGGCISFIIGGRSRDIAFIVSLAGSGVKGDVLMAAQREAICSAMGMSRQAIDANEDMVGQMEAVIEKYGTKTLYENPDMMLAELLPEPLLSDESVKNNMLGELRFMASPEIRSFMDYDPAHDLRRIKCPLLALNGEKDLQVPADMNLDAIKSAVKKATVKKYPDLNHLFQHAQTGLPDEYSVIEETMSPEVLQDVAAWILKTVR